MTDEDLTELAAAAADELADSAYGIRTEDDRRLTARLVVLRIESTLRSMGWMPPETYERITAWAAQTASLPEHHVNQSVLTSQLSELSDILQGR